MRLIRVNGTALVPRHIIAWEVRECRAQVVGTDTQYETMVWTSANDPVGGGVWLLPGNHDVELARAVGGAK